MTKQEIVAQFDAILSSPMAYKDGGYILENILFEAKKIVKENRIDIVSIVRDWLETKREPYLSLGLGITREMKLTELKPDIESLRGNINLYPDRVYQTIIDKVLKEIS